jgi:hypothetical protein
MTLSGYITDRRCPSNPEHGNVFGMRDGGYNCTHSDHHAKNITQSFWTENEFQAAKSLPTPQPTGNVLIKKPKKARRRR